MRTAVRVCVVFALLLVFTISPVGASEPVGSGNEGDARVAPKSDRADGMAAWSVDSGGGESSGGDFSLIAAIGQPDAGVVARGGTALEGGVWAGAVDLGFIFGDGFESSGTDAWSSAVGGNP